MKEETRNFGGTVLSIIIKILVIIAFIFLLLWLFPTKQSLNPIYETIFRENIYSMRDAAEKYYTNERLPMKIGEKVTISLREMLEGKMVLPFVDRYNKSCDEDLSYVEVIRTKTEWEMKVNLVCSREENYIIVHLGCTDYCVECNEYVEKEEETVLEYEFKKSVKQDVISGYTCPFGYTLSGSKCIKKTTTTDKIDAYRVYDYKKINPTIKTTYSDWTDFLEREYLVVSAQYDANDNIISKTPVTNIEEVNTNTRVVQKTNYSNGSALRKVTETRYVDDTTKPIYEDYYFPIGSVTIKECSSYKYFIDTSSGVVYKYTGGGGQIVTGFDFVSCGGSCTLVPSYYTDRYTGATAIGTTSSLSGTTLSATCNTVDKTITKYAKGRKFIKYEQKIDGKTINFYGLYLEKTRNSNTTTTCPTGYTLRNNMCYSKDKTQFVGYSCRSGYTLKNDKCIKTNIIVDSIKATAKYKTETVVKYIWSRAQSLTGWIRTGRTRTVIQ